MKRVLIGLVFLAMAALIYWFFRMAAEKTPASVEYAPVALQSRSEGFSDRLASVLDAYMAMKDAFVEFDTSEVRKNAVIFLRQLDSIPLDELKKDSGNVFESAEMTRDEIRKNIEALLERKEITGMRKDFSNTSDLLYPDFLKLINYSGAQLYLQHCPMAFHDTAGANWLSRSAEIMNPYLGRFDPKYKSGMLHCGEVLDSTGKR